MCIGLNRYSNSVYNTSKYRDTIHGLPKPILSYTSYLSVHTCTSDGLTQKDCTTEVGMRLDNHYSISQQVPKIRLSGHLLVFDKDSGMWYNIDS